MEDNKQWIALYYPMTTVENILKSRANYIAVPVCVGGDFEIVLQTAQEKMTSDKKATTWHEGVCHGKEQYVFGQTIEISNLGHWSHNHVLVIRPVECLGI